MSTSINNKEYRPLSSSPTDVGYIFEYATLHSTFHLDSEHSKHESNNENDTMNDMKISTTGSSTIWNNEKILCDGQHHHHDDDVTVQQHLKAAVMSLTNFIEEIPLAIASSKQTQTNYTKTTNAKQIDNNLGKQDLLSIAMEGEDYNERIMTLMRNVQLNQCEINRYAHFDSSRKYTRNLISTDHTSYTLLLLCWNPGQYSPIHDHPCDGCYMKILHGHVHECVYEMQKKKQIQGGNVSCTSFHERMDHHPTTDDTFLYDHNCNSDENNEYLVCTKDTIGNTNDVIYINDCIGYHKVGNPSLTDVAITLHLYCPPFDECQIWLDDNQIENSTSSGHQCHSITTTIRHDTEYGNKNI